MSRGEKGKGRDWDTGFMDTIVLKGKGQVAAVGGDDTLHPACEGRRQPTHGDLGKEWKRGKRRFK